MKTLLSLLLLSLSSTLYAHAAPGLGHPFLHELMHLLPLLVLAAVLLPVLIRYRRVTIRKSRSTVYRRRLSQ